MGRPMSYTCKACNVEGTGPGDLGRHYKAYPTHKPSYKKVGGQKVRFIKTQQVVKHHTQDASITAINLFLDSPQEISTMINAKILEQRKVISDANVSIQEAELKIKRLEVLYSLMSHEDEPREVLASHGENFHVHK